MTSYVFRSACNQPRDQSVDKFLISGQPGTRLHSQYDNGAVSRAAKIQGREAVLINPTDAAARGIEDGSVVELFNDRGRCLEGARVTADVMPGLVFLWTGAWYDPDFQAPAHRDRHGNPNVLTHDLRTSEFSQSPASHSAQVDVAPFKAMCLMCRPLLRHLSRLQRKYEPMTDETKPRVDSTLSKGLSILEHLSANKGSHGVSDLSRALGLTKSNTFRLLQTLVALGYVRHEADKTYSATLKTWQVGRNVVENLNLRVAAAPMMKYLADETTETIYLAVRDGLSVIYIDKIESVKPIRSWNPVGGNAPLYCVGTGKSMLAEDYTVLRDRVATELTAHTDRTLTELADLDRDMAQTKMRGYAVDTGEYRANIYSLGAAIWLPGVGTVGALGLSVPDVNLQDGDIERFGALIKHAAASVSQSLARL